MYMNTPRTAETASLGATAPRSLANSLTAKTLAFMATIAASAAACTSVGHDSVTSTSISNTSDSGETSGSGDAGSTYDSGSGFPVFDGGGFPTFDTGSGNPAPFDAGTVVPPDVGTVDTGTVDTGVQGTDAGVDGDTDSGVDTAAFTIGKPCPGAETVLGTACAIKDPTNPNNKDGIVVCHDGKLDCDSK